MSETAPVIAYVPLAQNEPGYMVGTALDELVSWAREKGCSEEELRERLEEAFERFEEDGS